jgi:hypothetical protein
MAATLLADYAKPNVETVSTSPPGEPTRDSILAAFARARVPPQPVAQPRQTLPESPSPGRPWFAGPQPQEREELSEAAIDELLASFYVGNIA